MKCCLPYLPIFAQIRYRQMQQTILFICFTFLYPIPYGTGKCRIPSCSLYTKYKPQIFQETDICGFFIINYSFYVYFICSQRPCCKQRGLNPAWTFSSFPAGIDTLIVYSVQNLLNPIGNRQVIIKYNFKQPFQFTLHIRLLNQLK